MSSKLLTSVRTLSRSEKEEWKDDDLEDFEVVRPGGEPEPGIAAGSSTTGRSYIIILTFFAEKRIFWGRGFGFVVVVLFEVEWSRTGGPLNRMFPYGNESRRR
jgi:hypothetical protein